MGGGRTTGPVCVDLHGVALELHSTEPDFTDYAADALSAIRSETERAPKIVSRLEWVEKPPSTDPKKAFAVGSWDRQPDRDLYIAGSDAYWLRIEDFTDLQMKIGWQDGRLELTGRYHFQIGRRPRWEPLRRLRYASRIPELRGRRFSTLVYYLVYYPLLWWLSRFDGWHVLHAGAVARDHRAYVFAGLPGCGKSTLAVASLAEPGFDMLSDNLLLTDGARVRAFPEPLLLDAGSIARIGPAAARLVHTGDRRVYERDAYRPERFVMEPLDPVVIHLVGRAHDGAVNPLDREKAAARIEAGNVLAKEVRRSRIMSQVVDLLAGTKTPDERAVVASLASGPPCFELWISPQEQLSQVVRSRLLATR
jgi:hypothetical protein